MSFYRHTALKSINNSLSPVITQSEFISAHEPLSADIKQKYDFSCFSSIIAEISQRSDPSELTKPYLCLSPQYRLHHQLREWLFVNLWFQGCRLKRKLTVCVGGVGVDELIAFIDAVLCACKGRIALRQALFTIIFGYGDIEFL